MNDYKLPDLTKQAIEHIDGTPDDEYVIRILKAYRYNCDVKWASNTNGEDDNPLCIGMNKHNDERAKLLDEAIELLSK